MNIKRIKRASFVAFIVSCFSMPTYGLVSVGFYSGFGSQVQKDADGSRRTYDFDPTISFNHPIPAPFKHVFLPEIGIVFHRGLEDSYSKNTTFLLLDLGYKISSSLLLRYGVGLFRTSISGDGGQIELGNGASTTLFDKPAQTAISYNTTIDLGVEYAFNDKQAARIQMFFFSMFGDSRGFSHSINWIYYL